MNSIRAASLQSVLDNYQVLLEVWDDALVSKVDGEMRARIVGVDTPMHTFDFLFGASAGNLLLHHTHKKEDVLCLSVVRITSKLSMHVSSKIRPAFKSMVLPYQGNEGLHIDF